MNRREAKAYVLRVMAAETRHHIDNGSDWLERPLRADGVATDSDGSFTQADQERVRNAVLELADELEARSARMRTPAESSSS